MSDQKKNKYEGETFENIIKDSMHKGSIPYLASRLIEDFSSEKKDETLTRVKGLASVVDRLKMLLEQLDEEEQDVQEDE
jgi:hypothetical protein